MNEKELTEEEFRELIECVLKNFSTGIPVQNYDLLGLSEIDSPQPKNKKFSKEQWIADFKKSL